MASRRPNGMPPVPNHSVRVPDELWNAVKEKAYQDGQTMAGLINRMLADYMKDAA